jgi:hypothetical protein
MQTLQMSMRRVHHPNSTSHELIILVPNRRNSGLVARHGPTFFSILNKVMMLLTEGGVRLILEYLQLILVKSQESLAIQRFHAMVNQTSQFLNKPMMTTFQHHFGIRNAPGKHAERHYQSHEQHIFFDVARRAEYHSFLYFFLSNPLNEL